MLTGHDLDRIEVHCDVPLPLQADGEDLGDVREAVFEAERDAVTVSSKPRRSTRAAPASPTRGIAVGHLCECGICGDEAVRLGLKRRRREHGVESAETSAFARRWSGPARAPCGSPSGAATGALRSRGRCARRPSGYGGEPARSRTPRSPPPSSSPERRRARSPPGGPGSAQPVLGGPRPRTRAQSCRRRSQARVRGLGSALSSSTSGTSIGSAERIARPARARRDAVARRTSSIASRITAATDVFLSRASPGGGGSAARR